MFDTIVSVDKKANTKLSTTAQTIGCAIAYAVGMEDAHIHVFEEGGIFILEGYAPSIDAIERASQIAMAIVGPKVCNRIHPVDLIHIVRR